MNNNELCPVCETGRLREKLEILNFIKDEVIITAPLHYSVCNMCHTIQTDHVQVKTNKNAITVARFMAGVN